MEIQIPERAASRYGGRYERTADVHRLFEILRDSIRVALESSDPETARARYDLAIECFHQLRTLDLPDEIDANLRDFVEGLVARFPTAWRVNAALRACERAGEAKRASTRRDRLEDAREHLLSGRGEADVDQAEIEALLEQVEAYLESVVEDDAAPSDSIEVRPAGSAAPAAVDDDAADAIGDALEAGEPAEAEAPPAACPDCEVTIGLLPRVHFAMLRGRRSPVHSIAVTNGSEDELEGARLELSSEPPFFATTTVELPRLEPGETLELEERRIDSFLRFDPALLARLTERADGHVRAQFVDATGHELAIARATWQLQPADFWPGLAALPEVLAAFVLPNDPFVGEILADAATRLAEDGAPAGLDGYQSKDPVHALRMVRAIYAALRDARISYANPPASFEDEGQRVRFPAAIARTRIATCLDMSLLAAAALEQAGLHAIVVLVSGHAFVGTWLIERTFSNPIVDEPMRLAKRAELTELVLFDPTCATSRPSPDFEGARQAAEEHIEDRDAFRFAVDVQRARLGGVRPLPTLSSLDDSDGAEGAPQSDAAPTRPERDLEADLAAYLEADRLRREAEETPATRLDRWLRHLLDLTMRNRLLNSSSSSKRVVPLLGAHLEAVEDRLADGKTLRILERPSELVGKGPPDDEAKKQIEPLLAAGVEAGELRSHVDSADLDVRLTNLYREARTAREEGGANSLYLAVGFLAYRETPQSTKVRRAPLLLVPLEMKRLSGRRGYSLVQGGDETRINVTLLEYLRRDHDIDVAGLDPLPQDDKGVDVALVLRVFKDAIKDEDTWEVLEEAQVGLYSFSKYLLWRDLKDRSDVLRENALVAHLIDRPNEPFEGDVESPDPHTLDHDVAASEVYAPLSYDSTQLSAILAAARGRTMVLEGPPGTGKSQTITNLIAHAIAKDKRVLFVSEKMAALDVVHRRLRSLGLGPACLELHSNKANKKGVLEQFKESLDEGRVRGSRRRKWDEISADVDAARTRLNRHVAALHDARRSGESIHGVVARASATAGDAPPGLTLDLDDPRAVEESTLRRWRDLLKEIDAVAPEEFVGPDHPLLLVGRTEYSPIVEDETRAALRAYDAPASEFLAAAGDVLSGLGATDGDGRAVEGVVLPSTGEAWDALQALAASVVEPPDMGEAAETALGGGDVIDRAEASVAAAAELAEIRADFDARFRVSPTTLDLGALEAARRATAAGGILGFFKRWRARGELRDAFRGIASDPGAVRVDDAVRALDAARRSVELEARVAAVGEDERALLGETWSGASTDAAAARARVARVRAIAGRLSDLVRSTGSRPESIAAALATAIVERRGDLASADGALARRFRALEDARRAHAASHESVLAAAEPLPGAPLGESLDDVAGLQSLVLRWTDAWSGVRGWTRWQALRRDAVASGLDPVVAALESGDLAPGAARAAFDAAFARAWSLHEISADDALKAFDGTDHARAIDRFVGLDEERLDAAREEVRQHVGSKRPQPATLREKNKGSALGTLQREITKKTRHIAIRRLLSELGELAMDLKPCFLMSPMSVAQYLEADHPRFDLVVFDEASQIPVWDAIGAIARGQQAVVVGDPKQLPPTSFFSRGEDETIEEDEIQDLESILEECIGAQVPTQRLAWHYRSRHESLIAFSNERYYDRGLLTFPSNSSEGLGVSMRHVPEGVYDKGRTRTNAVEAKAVVEEVVRRLRDPLERERSIGVVTFSQAQQTLMLDLFDEAVREHPEIERAFDEGREEPVFVKNLENVQGDERDVIVFSIGYGPDARGRVSMNFGPLNKDGGERRLNVAVTRAREEVVVFSSLRSEQIDLARTSARAVRDLQAFLRHAERGTAGTRPDAALADVDGDRDDLGEGGGRDELVRTVARRLGERGWDVETEVGSSSVRVDLAVRHPDRPGRFLVGIETDGRNYARAATARDRDRLRSLVLGGLGWQILRVWTVDWWRDADAEVDRIDAAARAALEADRAASASERGLVRSDAPDGAVVAVDEPDASPEPE